MVTCPACDGRPPGRGAPVCLRCRSRLEVPTTVPGDVLAARKYREFMVSLGLFRAHGVLPDAGGLMDQPATWVDAAHLVMGRLAEIEADELEQLRRTHASRR